MKAFVVFLFLFSGCATHPKKVVDESNSIDVHVHIHPGSDDDLQYNGERALLAVESSGIKRAFVLGHAFNRFNNPKCWSDRKNCKYDSKWVREINTWTINEAKKYPQLIPFCGIEIGEKIDSASEIEFCRLFFEMLKRSEITFLVREPNNSRYRAG